MPNQPDNVGVDSDPETYNIYDKVRKQKKETKKKKKKREGSTPSMCVCVCARDLVRVCFCHDLYEYVHTFCMLVVFVYH